MTALETYLRDQKEHATDIGSWQFVYGKIRWGYWLDYDSAFIEYRYTGKCALVRKAVWAADEIMTHAWQMDVVSCEAYKHDRLDAIRKHQMWLEAEEMVKNEQ